MVVSLNFIYTFSDEKKYERLKTAYCYSERIPCVDVSTIVTAEDSLGVDHGFVIRTREGERFNFYCDTEE